MRQTTNLNDHKRFRPTKAMRARAKDFSVFVVQSLVRAGVRAPALVSSDALVNVYYAFEAQERARA